MAKLLTTPPWLTHTYLRAGAAFLLLSLLAAPFSQATVAQTDEQRLGKRALATTSLAAKEYAEGVVEGRIVAQEEVDEARLFLGEARSAIEQLPHDFAAASLPFVDSMLATVSALGSSMRLASLADSVRRVLNERIPGLNERIPAVKPDQAIGESIYASACATCHGGSGAGDGPAGLGLEPAPSDLTASGPLSDQSPLDYFRKVLIGVSGTAMPAFEGNLTEDEIWEVAWHATQLRYPPPDGSVARQALDRWCADCNVPGTSNLPAAVVIPADLADPENVARATDEDLYAHLTAGANAPISSADSAELLVVVGFLRRLPFAVEPTAIPAFSGARAEVLRGIRLARTGAMEAASAKLLDAYVAFEEVEPEIAVRNNALTSNIESTFAQLRGRVGSGASEESIARSYQQLDQLLTQAETSLATQPSSIGLFVQSFFLLLREGMEAFLIVGALAALVVKAGAPDSKRAIWWGVWLALGASVVTAILIETIFRIGVAQQEILEGATMLLAAGVLLFVSYWLVSKIEVTRWKNFLSEQGTRAIRQGSLLTLAGAAFLAVYREGFETILFYKALFLTSGANGIGSISAGAVVATIALAVLYLGISRFGLRIPVRQFFAVTSAVLMYMAFSFAGKGIAELQESSLISTTIVEWAPRVPWMGIYPTTQSLVLQVGILTLIIAGLIWTFAISPRLATTPK